jgi:hypothetical protein
MAFNEEQRYLNEDYFGGNLLYMSPDVLKGNFTYSSDVW